MPENNCWFSKGNFADFIHYYFDSICNWIMVTPPPSFSASINLTNNSIIWQIQGCCCYIVSGMWSGGWKISDNTIDIGSNMNHDQVHCLCLFWKVSKTYFSVLFTVIWLCLLPAGLHTILWMTSQALPACSTSTISMSVSWFGEAQCILVVIGCLPFEQKGIPLSFFLCSLVAWHQFVFPLHRQPCYMQGPSFRRCTSLSRLHLTSDSQLWIVDTFYNTAFLQ